MRDPFARRFYGSYAWQQCRRAYLKSAGNLCESCLKSGQITPADDVHHKIRLTPGNIDDPSVTLNWENLEALCEACHKSAHKMKRRYKVDETGRVVVLEAP